MERKVKVTTFDYDSLSDEEKAEINKQREERAKRRIELAKESGLTYERLFELAYKMHLQIYLLAGDHEQEVYDEIGLTEEENSLFGYQFVGKEIEMPEEVKEHIINLVNEIKENEENAKKEPEQLSLDI